MCDIDFDGFCPVWEQTPHVAKKAYRCDGCAGRILPGEPYLRHFSVYDGGANDEQCCFGCWWAQEDFGQAHKAYAMPGYLWEALQECVDAESRAYWSADDRRWRSYLAGMKLRRRRAQRAETH